jgi:hypothetical protein
VRKVFPNGCYLLYKLTKNQQKSKQRNGIWSPANAMEETLQFKNYNACRGKFVLSFNGKKH